MNNWINLRTHKKNYNFILANLWDRSIRNCPPILMNIPPKLIKLSPFSILQWTNKPTNRHTNKKFQFYFSQSVRKVQGNMCTNFGKNILKTEQIIPLLHFSMNKLTNWRTHKPKNSNFILSNLWDMSRVTCVPILVKISWKLSKFSNFLMNVVTDGVTNEVTNGVSEWGCYLPNRYSFA